MKNKIFLLLILISAISLFLNLIKNNSAPPCFNADEAAFGYNAYSILKTGKDEYGNFLPLRLKSFGDYKMPLYSYFSIPFIKIFGLNESSIRMLNTFLAFFFPIIVFFLAQELWGNNNISLVASFLISLSMGLHIVARHAHEAFLAAFLTCLATLFFIKAVKKSSYKYYIVFCLIFFISLFAYQANRIFFVFYLIVIIAYFFNKKKLIKIPSIVLFIIVFLIFSLSDIVYKPERVKNLLFINNIGFKLKINELKTEGGVRLLNNEILIGSKDLIFRYLKYFSPQFLIINGDENLRFGYPDISPLTPLEYIFIFIGIYYLFKKGEKWRFFIIGIFLISPIPAALTWTDMSLTRSLFMLIPALLISSYGFVAMLISLRKNYLLPILILFGFLFFISYSWNFYLFHYPKRSMTIKSWQCGNKEMAEYVSNNYQKFNKFYITKKNGQPYIFLLFYLKYPPLQYQKQAQLSSPDEYGFGQVEGFDKFMFTFKIPPQEKKVALIGYPDDYFLSKINYNDIKKIQFKNQEIFGVYEIN